MTKTEIKSLATQLAATEPRIRAIYVSTFPPRECGIATYTKDLATAINLLNPHCLADIIAIDDEKSGGEAHDYPWEVKYKIDQEDLRSWMNAADYINQSGAEVVNLQHEFGIYGGVDGEYIIPFMEAIKKPIVVCLHTVLPNPHHKMKETVQRIAEKAAAIIVIVNAAGQCLIDEYGVDPSKIVTIPHGVPDISFGSSDSFKEELGYAGWNIISSFGLLSSSKGYEYAIDALPGVLKKYPKTKLLLIGETHPVVQRREGEVYRNTLKQQIAKLKLKKHVEFINRYLPVEEIIEYLKASDIYITPYPNMNQVSSGTLSYAVSAGRACISTPYVYAKEVLAEERGVLMKPNNSQDLAEKINYLLDHPRIRQKIAKNAYRYGRNMTWSRVALRHLDLFEIVTKEHEKARSLRVS